nr:hypothetical protein [Tanacetum cinerariifolium]
MSDSDESGVTYTDISSPFEELSDIGSPRADDHEHLMLPEMLEDPYVEETKPFETDESTATPPPHPAYRMTARISIPAPVPMPAWTDSEIPFPPLPPILSRPSPVLSPAPPPSPIRSLGYRAAMIRLRDEAASTSSPPLQLPSASHREDIPEGAPVSTDTELGGYMKEFETRVRQDTDEIYMRQTERQLLAGRLNMLFRDRHHRRSTEIIELRTALQGQVTALQGHVTALQAQVTTLQGQQGLAGGPTQPELPEEAGSSS